MERNPYSPPEAAVTDAVKPDVISPEGRLYTPGQIGLATFLGSMVAGSWFYGANLVTLHRATSRWPSLLVGIGLTIALIVVFSFLPDKTSNALPGILSMIAARQYADMKFGKIVVQHVGAGGKKGSWWFVAGVSLLFLIPLLALAFAPMLLLGKDS